MKTMNLIKIRKICLGVLIAAAVLFLGDEAFDLIDLPLFLKTVLGMAAAGSVLGLGSTFLRKEEA